MPGKIMEPQAPLLPAQLPLNRIAVLIESLEIAEDPHDFLASDAQWIDSLWPATWMMNRAMTAG
jgi:hypothetical protein